MSTTQLRLSLQEIVPTYHGKFPPQLLSFIESLYLLSLQKKPTLPNRAEIARFHICAFLAAEKYQSTFSLPQPEVRRIPLQPKIAAKLLDDFRDNLLNQIRSCTSTPRKNASSNSTSPAGSPELAYSTPLLTPTGLTKLSPLKLNINKSKISSPLKRLRDLENEDDSEEERSVRKKTPRKPNKEFNIESPFNPKPSASPSASVGSEFSSESEPESPDGLPKKKKSKSTKLNIYKYDRKHVSIVDFIAFANSFFIPAEITPRMVETFLVHKHKFVKKSEWLLACGMIHSAYIRINHKILTSKMGAKQKIVDQLFQYQKGGLMKKAMQLWLDIVEDWINDEAWIRDIEKQFMYDKDSVQQQQLTKEREARIGPGWGLLEKFGSMLHGDVLYDSKTQEDYYNTWTSRVLESTST